MALVARAAWLSLAVAAFLPLAAHADMSQQNSGDAWRQASRCAHEAFKQYPDYTPASNAKREAARRACLRDHQLPAPGSVAAPPADRDKL
jgi:hypothetical protein